jgi:non-homologous end joining protein Ku
MVCFLPNEFMAPANQVVQEEASPDINEDEQLKLMAQLVLAKQATFDKPGQKSAYEAAVLERIHQWQAIDQDVC